MSDRKDNQPRISAGTSTAIRKGYEGLGRMLVKHVAKVAVGLGVAFVFVWDFRGEMDAAEQARMQRLQTIEQRLDVIEKFCCKFGAAAPTVIPANHPHDEGPI